MVKIWKNPGNSGRNEKLAIKFKLRGHSLTFWPNFGLSLKSELCPVNCHPSLGVPSANRLIKISFAVLIDPPRGCPRVAFPPRPLLTICGCLLFSPFLFCPSQSFQRPPAPIKISFFCRCRSRPPSPSQEISWSDPIGSFLDAFRRHSVELFFIRPNHRLSTIYHLAAARFQLTTGGGQKVKKVLKYPVSCSNFIELHCLRPYFATLGPINSSLEMQFTRPNYSKPRI